MANYQDPNKEENVRRRLNSLHQTNGMTHREYTNKFDDLAIQVEGMHEQDKLYHFLEGLHEDVRKVMGPHQPETLAEAKELASRAYAAVTRGTKRKADDKDTDSVNDYSQEAKKKKFKGFQKKKFPKSSTGNYGGGKPKANLEKPKKNLDHIKCWNCGKTGHYSTNCKEKKMVSKPVGGHAPLQTMEAKKKAFHQILKVMGVDNPEDREIPEAVATKNLKAILAQL